MQGKSASLISFQANSFILAFVSLSSLSSFLSSSAADPTPFRAFISKKKKRGKAKCEPKAQNILVDEAKLDSVKMKTAVAHFL
jgi:hypothetical protein